MSSQEVDTTLTDKLKRQSSVITNDPNRFQYGVLIRGKFIGVEDVKKENGDDVCQTAMIKLKAVVAAKKEHKTRICIKINLDGIEILDEKTNTTMFKHAVTRISYIARDPTDSRAIGYIYKNSPNNFQYFAIKTEKQAQELFNTLKDLFEVVLEMRNNAKKNNEESKDVKENENKEQPKEQSKEQSKEEPKNENKPSLTSLKSVDSNDQIISGLEEKIKQMNDQPNLLDLPGQAGFEDSFQSSLEKSSDQSAKPATKPSNELFDLFDSTNISNPPANQPKVQSQNEKYNSLVNELSNLSTSPQPRSPPVPPLPPMNMGQNPMSNPMMNPFQNQPFYGQPMVNTMQTNPFGGFAPNPMQQAPMQQNPMQQNQFQMQRPPVPNSGMFMQPMAGNQPMQQNTFNSNPTQQNNQFPW